jgi:hypothetical protein
LSMLSVHVASKFKPNVLTKQDQACMLANS